MCKHLCREYCLAAGWLRFHISFWTVATPATVHRYIRGKIYLPDSQTVPQILNGLLFILSRQFNNQREVMASFPFKEALFVGCKALWNKPVWEVYVWYRALLRHAFLLGLFTYAGIVIAMGFGDGEGEHDNLSRWIGSFVIAVLSRLLNKVFCCPDKKLRPWQKESRKKGSGGRDAGMTERQTGRRRGREGGHGKIDEELWLVKTREARRGRGCEMSSGLYSPESQWLTDPEPGCTRWKGPITAWVMGLCHCGLCAQVRSLGVLAHQVSIGLNKTAATIRAAYSGGCPPCLRDDVWGPSLFFHKTPWKGSRWQ